MSATADMPPPLVLLVEDDDRSRELMQEAFTDQDCKVIAVADPDQAVFEMRSAPGIDLLVSDVKLRADDDDTSGMRLGEYLKNIRPDIPVALYSSIFYENQLDSALDGDTRTRFDIVLPRGGPKWSDEHVLDGCVELARQYRDRRFAQASAYDDSGPEASITVMREFTVGASAERSSDEVLQSSGYTLRLLDVRYGGLRGPIAVWVLERDGHVSAELYQNSSVHSVGATVAEALNRLARVLHEQMEIVTPEGLAPNQAEQSIGWLMLEHAEEWERVASDIGSRD